MLEFRSSSAVVIAGNKPRGILTSKDILMRVIGQNFSPDETPVEKVMTPNPECATLETPIVDALHAMHEGKFLHLPVVNRDGNVAAVVDVIHMTHAAVATIGNTGGINNEATSTMTQKFWDSAMGLSPNDDEETRSEGSLKLTSEGTETGRYLPYPSSTYEDEELDKVVLASDNDLITAVDHARSAGLKGLRLHLDYSGTPGRRRSSNSESLDYVRTDAWAAAYSAVAAGAALIAGLGVLAYLKRSGE